MPAFSSSWIAGGAALALIGLAGTAGAGDAFACSATQAAASASFLEPRGIFDSSRK